MPDSFGPFVPGPARLVVLVSGSGTNLQALLDASADPAYGVSVVAVGADRPGSLGEERARAAGVATFVCAVGDYPDRSSWDAALAARVAAHSPDMVMGAGFLKLVGDAFLGVFGGRYLNTHPALLPSFPGMHGARDALRHGVKITGAIVAQVAVPVLDDDSEATLTERIKAAEQRQLVDWIGQMARKGWTINNRKVTVP